ncbi:hypothetical protein [Paenibacillus sp. GCM10012306]
MKKSLLTMTAVLALFSFIIIGTPAGKGGNGGTFTTLEHGVGY